MADDYLMMSRVMERELKEFIQKRDSEWRNMTGMEQIITKSSFKSGFMAGFYLKFTKGEE